MKGYWRLWVCSDCSRVRATIGAVALKIGFWDKPGYKYPSIPIGTRGTIRT